MPYQTHIWAIYGSPPPPNLDFGLCARVSPAVCEPAIEFSTWSAVSHLKSRDFRFHEPTILFSNWSAVSPSKSHDFRLYEPTIPFYPLVSGITNFPLGQRFPISNHVTSGFKTRDFRLPEPTIPFSTWSAVSHPTSGHDVTRPIRSQEICYLSPLYYSIGCKFFSRFTVYKPTEKALHITSFHVQIVNRFYFIPRNVNRRIFFSLFCHFIDLKQT